MPRMLHLSNTPEAGMPDTSRTALLNAVLDTVGEGIITADQDSTIVLVNREVEHIWGYTEEELIGRSLDLLMPEEYRTQHEAAIQRYLSTRVSVLLGRRREVVGLHKDGHIFPMELHIRETLIANQHFFTAAVRDLTEQKAAEQRLLQAERERLALQEQIIQAQAAMVAELSTPLLVLGDGVIVMPIIGGVDSHRAQQVIHTLLEGVAAHHTRTVILDITGVPVVDTTVANALIQAARAVRLLGATVVLTGIRPEVAQTLVGIGIDLASIITRSTLQAGIAYGLGRG